MFVADPLSDWVPYSVGGRGWHLTITREKPLWSSGSLLSLTFQSIEVVAAPVQKSSDKDHQMAHDGKRMQKYLLHTIQPNAHIWVQTLYEVVFRCSCNMC